MRIVGRIIGSLKRIIGKFFENENRIIGRKKRNNLSRPSAHATR